jgi:hypothetical protein
LNRVRTAQARDVEPGDLGLDRVGSETGHHDHLGDSRLSQVLQLPMQHGAARKLDQALGARVGQGRQALALAGAEDDGFGRFRHGRGLVLSGKAKSAK